MEEFDSGWDEPPSSLDSEIMNNFDISEAMNAFEQSELHQQVLEMRDDPAMSFHGQNITNHSTPGNKEASAVECTSLSSEIFLATRLLHDETLDVTTLNTLGDTDSSPYNDHQNVNYLVGANTLGNVVQPDVIDAIGLPQREALDSEFLFSSFERLNTEKQDYDEECSNKSWTESFPPSEIMPAPVQPIPRKKIGEKKPRERKRRLVKVIRKKFISMENTIEEVIKNSIGDTNSSDSIDSLLSKSENINYSTELRLKNPILSNAIENNTEVNFQSQPELRLKNPILSNALQNNDTEKKLKNNSEVNFQSQPELRLKNPILSNAIENNTEVNFQSQPELRLKNPILSNAIENNMEVNFQSQPELRLKNPILSNALKNNMEVNFQSPPDIRLKNPILSNALKNHSEVSLNNTPELQLKNPILSNALLNNKEITFKNPPLPFLSDIEISLKNPSTLEQNDFKTDIPLKSSPPLTSQTFSINSGIDDEFLIPSTSGLNSIQKKDGRRVPSYLKMYRLRDDKYPDVFSCKNCFGIYTTLDAAMFHPCLKKRRGRRPKLLQDCVVPS